jgi:hypothetical protein
LIEKFWLLVHSVAKIVSSAQRVGPPMCEAAHTASVAMCIMS